LPLEREAVESANVHRVLAQDDAEARYRAAAV
jgi:hypothetical protein